MISVAEATQEILKLTPELGTETCSLDEAQNRVLATPLKARLNQPPWDQSAMDGYAVRRTDLDTSQDFEVIGEALAGQRFLGEVETGQAVRIFTGAPVPSGADWVVIQENATRDGETVRFNKDARSGKSNIRAKGSAFAEGNIGLEAGIYLNARALALAAAMNHAEVTVKARPRVAILSTGDELVRPGETPGPDQLIASNAIGLAAQIRDWGGTPVDLGLVADQDAAIKAALTTAEACDILITIGGVSVGDYDRVRPVLDSLGVTQSFWKIAMKPGKPLMAGRWEDRAVLGLPGNPVSALVTAHLYLQPLIKQALGWADPLPLVATAPLGAPLKDNGNRQDYLRAEVTDDGVLMPLPIQDSAQLTGLARAQALIIRPPQAPSAKAGESVSFHPL